MKISFEPLKGIIDTCLEMHSINVIYSNAMSIVLNRHFVSYAQKKLFKMIIIAIFSSG